MQNQNVKNILKCLCLKLIKKYGKTTIEECWYEAIRLNNNSDYKYFDYFTDTTHINNSFANDGNLIQVEIPNSVLHIEEYAFDNCQRITSVIFPQMLQRIEKGHLEIVSILLYSSTVWFASN